MQYGLEFSRVPELYESGRGFRRYGVIQRWCWNAGPLYRQCGTALGSARTDHGAARAGFHARTKTVGTRAAYFGRLISTFHVNYSLSLDFASVLIVIPPGTLSYSDRVLRSLMFNVRS